MSKRLIIHGGIHKTGTTTLQIVLWELRDSLLNSGVLYPVSGVLDGAHHLLAREFARDGIDGSQIISDFVKECDKFDGTVIVSSEEFCLFDVNSICGAIDFLKPNFKEVSVVFYLKPQALILKSQYSQQLREGYISESFDEFFERAKKQAEFWDFQPLCENWLTMLDTESLYVRSALDSDLIDNDIVQDFFGNFLGCFDRAKLPNIPNQNISLTLSQVCAIRKILKETDVGRVPFQERRMLLFKFIEQFAWKLNANDMGLGVPESIMRYCAERFRDENLYLSRFFGGKDIFGSWYQRQLCRASEKIEDSIGGLSQEYFDDVVSRAFDAWGKYMVNNYIV